MTGYRFVFKPEQRGESLHEMEKVFVIVDQDRNLTDILKAFKGFILATGFSTETWKKVIKEYAEGMEE